MVLKIQLREDEEQRVRELARERGLTPEQWALEAINAYTNRVSDEEFRRHLEASAKDNRELLRRLA